MISLKMIILTTEAKISGLLIQIKCAALFWKWLEYGVFWLYNISKELILLSETLLRSLPACSRIVTNTDYWQHFLPLGAVSHPQKELRFIWLHTEFFKCLSPKSRWVLVLLVRPCQRWVCISHAHVASINEQQSGTKTSKWKKSDFSRRVKIQRFEYFF